MTNRAANPSPPSDLDALQADLVELALGGAVTPAAGVREWLEEIGAIQETDGKTVIADEDWLTCSLPSPSAGELLARTLLRDPLYRLHVDLSLAEVIAAIGVSGRWSRLEELLFGDLALLAPRLAALMDLARGQDGSFMSASWRRLDPLSEDTASLLNERCWGVAGTPEELFPILRKRYPALASVPVFVRLPAPLVMSVVSAASTGEAVRVSGQQERELVDFAEQGVPFWWRHMADGQMEVTLSAPCRTRGEAEGYSTHPYSRSVPSLVRERSALLPTNPGITRTSFWEIVETATVGLAFVGASSRDAWPSDQDGAKRALPSGEHLESLVRSRRVERGAADPADEALRMLANHPLYGFWIQILLVEALDRELGEETLLFAPPTHAIVEDVEAATRVYYRPRPDATRQVRSLLELGTLDKVMNQIATFVDVRPVGVLGDAAGTWAMSLALLGRLGIVQTRHDRWALTAYSLDRLHGGGLMTGVIRRGRRFRERLHDALEMLWLECANAALEVRNA